MHNRILSIFLALILLCGSGLEAVSDFNTALASEAEVYSEEVSPSEPEPTAVPTPEPTAVPTPEPTAVPTPEPTVESTPVPEATDQIEDTPIPAETLSPVPLESPAPTLPAENVDEEPELPPEALLAQTEEETESIVPSGQTDYVIEGGVLRRYAGSAVDLTVPGDLGITAIGPNAFENNAELRTVVLPAGIAEIGDAAFRNCLALKSVALPDSLCGIGISAFEGCASLQSISLPRALARMGDRAFDGCANLTITVCENTPAQSLCDSAGYNHRIEGWPTEISLSRDKLFIGANETLSDALLPSVSPSGAAGYAVQYHSSNSKIVLVDAATGKLKGLKVGTATVTASIKNGSLTVAAQCAVTVRKAPAKVTLSPTGVTLGVEDTRQLTASLASDVASKLTYSSNNAGVASVDSNGLVTANAVGKATITVTTFNGQKATCAVTVKAAPESIALNAPSLTLAEGQASTLKVTLPGGTAASLTFSCETGNVSVNAKGVVTALREGSDTITVTTHNGATAECPVTVLPAPTTLSLNVTSVALGQKEKFTLVPSVEEGSRSSYTFKSNKASVASVSASGVITAKKTGSATITVKSYNGLTVNCAVTVKKAPTKITLSPNKVTLGAGETRRLTAKLSANSASKQITYSPNKASVATVSSDGWITANAVGSATITAKTFNGKKATCAVTVKAAPESVSFTSKPTVLGVGESFTLAAVVNSGAAGAITYSIEQEGECAVISGAKLTAKAPGTIKVVAEAYNEVRAEAFVEILPAPTSITLTETSLDLGLKETRSNALHAAVNPGSTGSFKFKSTNAGIVKVDAASGKLTAVKKGTAYVYAVAYNGVESARCKVVVRAAPTKVTLTVPTKKLSVGLILTPKITLNNGASGRCTLTSSNTDVIAVEDNTTLWAVGVGTARVTATSFNKKTHYVTITVVDPPSSVLPEQDEYTTAEGLSVRVAFQVPDSVTNYTYTSSDPSIASVESDGDGTVTGCAAGSAIITATTHNGLTASTTVHVLPAPRELVSAEDAVTLGVGETHLFTFDALPEDAVAEYTYSSSDKSVASVNARGLISATKTGSAVITATAQNGVAIQLDVNVVSYGSLHPAYAVAHRGASGYRKENTLDAFKYAVELGARAIELDVRKTKDDVIVVIHDATIRNSSGKKQNISALTLSQLKKIDSKIPTLEEALSYISETDAELMIEFKVAGIEQRVLDLVDRYGMHGRVIYGSFNMSINQKLRSIEPSSKLILCVQDASVLNDIIKNPSKYDVEVVTVKYTLLNAAKVCELHLAGFEIFAWTVNSSADIKKMANMGVDGITTNYPDRL